MAERPDQIEQHIASTRHELGNHLHELEHKVKQAADWRTYYERNPLLMLGAALGGGVMLASMMGRKREEAPTMPQGQRMPGTYPEPQGAVFDTWKNVRAALIGLSGTKLRSLLDQALPGFSEHYEKAAGESSRYSPSPTTPGRDYEMPARRM